MDRYQCHKQVTAAKITEVSEGFNAKSEFTVFLGLENGEQVEVGREYDRKHSPKAGGYYVVYEDGYKSFSPADAFEAGYSKV